MMMRNRRVDSIIKNAMLNAGLASTSSDVSLGQDREECTLKDNKYLRLERVRKKLDYHTLDETQSDEVRQTTTPASTPDTETANDDMEVTGFINNVLAREQSEVREDDYSFMRDETINSEEVRQMTTLASSPETLAANNDIMEMTGLINDVLTREQSEVPDDDCSFIRDEILSEEVPQMTTPASTSGTLVADSDTEKTGLIGMPNKKSAKEHKHAHFEVNVIVVDPPTASNTQDQVENTEDGLTTPEKKTANHTQVIANSANNTIVGNSQSGGSKTKKLRKGRKRKCKTDKMYIDYLSDEDYSTFIDCEEAEISDEWVGLAHSSNDDEVVANTAKTKRKKKTQPKKLNTALDDLDEEIVGEKGLRIKKKYLRRERSQKRASGQEYVRSDGKTIDSKSVQPNPCTGKKCGNNCENIDSERRQKVFDHFWDNIIIYKFA